jgi:hypothetical protein
MIRYLAPMALLLVSACHGSKVADVTLDADAVAQSNTAAKTLADLTAADQASSPPLPAPVKPIPAARSEPPAAAPENGVESVKPSDPDNGADAAPE